MVTKSPPQHNAPGNQEMTNVELWIVHHALDGHTVADFLEILSLEEKARAASFRFEALSNSYVVSHAVLRKILAWYTGRQAAEIAYQYGPRGKPSLPLALGDDVHFSLSRSENCFAVAVSRSCEVGVDIEVLRAIPEADEVGPSLFSPRECADIANAPSGLRAAAFLYHWTRNEARVKAAGDGLPSLSNAAGQPHNASAAQTSAADRSNHQAQTHWKFREFCSLPNCIGAVAVPTANCQFVQRDFSDAATCVEFLSRTGADHSVPSGLKIERGNDRGERI